MRTPRLVVSAVLVAAIGLAGPAFAKGGVSGGGGSGGGGGGTTTVKNGAIRSTGAVATCDGTSGFSITYRKGFDSRIETQFSPTGPEIGDGRWTVRVRAVELDKPLGGMGTTFSSNSLITWLLGGVPAGTHTLSFTAQRSAPNDLITDPTATVLETCTAETVVVAR